jgi:hypothetical protein
VPLLVLATLGAQSGYAQSDSRTFPETGHTVQGPFLDYWNAHGGLALQGYPISDELQQASPTDGKTYTVQYFERSIFELHPELAGTPNEVLLSLLGVFRYNELYPDGASRQMPNLDPNAQKFPETNHTVGGVFLDYWNSHGGLAQFGYPISDEFNEISPLDGNFHLVQYFQRAEFEDHPEFAGTPNEVLLSQLGTFAWQAKQAPPTPSATPTPHSSPTSTPLPPQPTATATPQPVPCDISGTWHGSAQPISGRVGTTFTFVGTGFLPGEEITFWITLPDGKDMGNRAPIEGGAKPDGTAGPVTYTLTERDVAMGAGRWTAHFRGPTSRAVSIIYFCVAP